MSKKRIYIFNGNTRAAAYGIGTYITQLIDCFRNTDISFGVINVYAEGDEVSVTEKDGYSSISIPAVPYHNARKHQNYTRNIAYLLKELIPEEKETEYIFHLNFMNESTLAKYLKKMFRCKLILVAHYSNWSFALLGDYQRLQDILSKSSRKRDELEKLIVSNIKEDEKMIRLCDKFVCIARHSLESFVKTCHIDISRTILINNALKDCYIPIPETKRKAIRKDYFISESTPVLIFAGRLDEVKGVSFLLQAFHETLKSHPDTRLFIAGEGDFNRWLKETGKFWAQVIFTGRIGKETLYELFQMADIGIVTSIHEEFGFVATEMMMHQLPVIVTETGGLSEIVEDEISGLKIPIIYEDKQRKVNVPVLVDKIRLLLDQPLLRKKMGTNGRKRFIEKYELTVFKNKMLNLYQSI